MKEQASPNTVRLVHEMMKLVEGQPLQDVKDAVCNMLASIIIGEPRFETQGQADEHARMCLRDVKRAIAANWPRRQLHHVEH